MKTKKKCLEITKIAHKSYKSYYGCDQQMGLFLPVTPFATCIICVDKHYTPTYCTCKNKTATKHFA